MTQKRLAIKESFAVASKIEGFSLKENYDQTKMVLMPKIEAIHAGTTANYTTYSEQCLQGSLENHSGVYSWTYPYPKPILKNHDTWEEPLGRVMSAQFITDSLTGKSANIVIPAITDPIAIEKILDGRYLTVSIGGETDSAICSICGRDIINDGWCEHDKGRQYEVKGKMVTCTWLIGELWFHELSFVNVPADEHAQVVASGNTVQMECYSYDGKNVTDLQTSKILSKKQAQIEGINLNEFKGGTDKVKTVEELQAKLGAVEAKLQESMAAHTALQEEMTKLQADVAEAQTAIETLTADKQSLSEALETAAAEIKSLTEASEKLVADKDELTAQVEQLGLEKTELMEKNADLATKIHASLAERVVDLKRSHGKPGCEDREAAIALHMERSEQSLQDSLIDLLAESQSGVFKSQIIEPPGIVSTKDKQGAEVEEGLEPQAAKLSKEDVFIGLLSKSKTL